MDISIFSYFDIRIQQPYKINLDPTVQYFLLSRILLDKQQPETTDTLNTNPTPNQKTIPFPPMNNLKRSFA